MSETKKPTENGEITEQERIKELFREYVKDPHLILELIEKQQNAELKDYINSVKAIVGQSRKENDNRNRHNLPEDL